MHQSCHDDIIAFEQTLQLQSMQSGMLQILGSSIESYGKQRSCLDVTLTLSYASCGDSTPEIFTGLFGDPRVGLWGLLGKGLLLAMPSGAAVVTDASAAAGCCCCCCCC